MGGGESVGSGAVTKMAKRIRRARKPKVETDTDRLGDVAAMMVDLMGDAEWLTVDLAELEKWLILGWDRDLQRAKTTRELCEDLIEMSVGPEHCRPRP